MLPTVPRNKPPAPPHESDHLRCSWTSAGERCRYAGVLSLATLGTGPWFCQGHFDLDDPITGDRIVLESRKTVLDCEHSAKAHVARARRAFAERVRDRNEARERAGNAPYPRLVLVKPPKTP